MIKNKYLEIILAIMIIIITCLLIFIVLYNFEKKCDISNSCNIVEELGPLPKERLLGLGLGVFLSVMVYLLFEKGIFKIKKFRGLKK